MDGWVRALPTQQPLSINVLCECAPNRAVLREAKRKENEGIMMLLCSLPGPCLEFDNAGTRTSYPASYNCRMQDTMSEYQPGQPLHTDRKGNTSARLCACCSRAAAIEQGWHEGQGKLGIRAPSHAFAACHSSDNSRAAHTSSSFSTASTDSPGMVSAFLRSAPRRLSQ